MNSNTYLIQDGCGFGEGIVIKNYNYKNRHGNINWAKMIHNEYSNSGSKKKGKEDDIPIEIKISQKYATNALIEKEYQKIINGDNFDSITDKNRIIPCLLQTTYYSIIEEEMWNIIKDYKNPTIKFKVLQKEITNRVRQCLPDLFKKEN